MEEDLKSTLDWAEGHLDDLVKYTQGTEFGKLGGEDQDLIIQQASAVNSLVDTLSARLERVKK
jgi:hypothetical protein